MDPKQFDCIQELNYEGFITVLFDLRIVMLMLRLEGQEWS